ncbi:MAG: hypothetical protein GX963_08815 [Bacteroidales bacterium]|nr:hypothetical protein [Bacteroidales bacterium]
MKHLLITIACCLVLASCTSQSDRQMKKVLLEALESKDGIRTDLKIKFTSMEVVDITVKDSIDYYQKKFSDEKKKQQTSAESAIEHYQKLLDEREAKENKDVVDHMLMAENKSQIKNNKAALDVLEQWHPKYLDKYNGRNENEVLAKLATASFKFTNPHTKANQEMIDKKFLFSPDGTKVLEIFVETDH